MTLTHPKNGASGAASDLALAPIFALERRIPRHRTDLAALRVVVKQGFGHDMADLLVADLQRQLPRLEKQQAPLHEAGATGFHH